MTTGTIAFLVITFAIYVLIPAIFASQLLHELRKQRLPLSVVMSTILLVHVLVLFAAMVMSGIVLVLLAPR